MTVSIVLDTGLLQELRYSTVPRQLFVQLLPLVLPTLRMRRRANAAARVRIAAVHALLLCVCTPLPPRPEVSSAGTPSHHVIFFCVYYLRLVGADPLGGVSC